MSVQYTIYEQEYEVLRLVAKPEQHHGAPSPYMSVYGGWEPRLIQFTIAQIYQYQQQRIQEKGVSWQAVGRYQFVYETLQRTVKKTGMSLNTIFNDVTQDLLALKLLEGAGLRTWQAAGQGPDKTPDQTFHFNLCKVWAGIPLPYPGNKGQTGQSYYEGAVNKARGSPEIYTDQLRQYRRNGKRTQHTVTLGVSARPYPVQGISPKSQATIRAGGGQNYGLGSPYTAAAQRRIQAGGTNFQSATEQIQQDYAGILPQADTPYVYEEIDPLDDRYDFRTGKKVRDLLLNGTAPGANLGLKNGNGMVPDDDIGAVGFTDDQKAQVTSNNTPGTKNGLPNGVYEKTQTVNTPGGPQQVTKQYKKVNTPGGIEEVEVKQPTPVSYISEFGNTRPDGSGATTLTSKPLPQSINKAAPPSNPDANDPRNQTTPQHEVVEDFDEREPAEFEEDKTSTTSNNDSFTGGEPIATAPAPVPFNGNDFCVKAVVFFNNELQAKIEEKESKIPKGDYRVNEEFDKINNIIVVEIVPDIPGPMKVVFSDGTTISKCPPAS